MKGKTVLIETGGKKFIGTVEEDDEYGIWVYTFVFSTAPVQKIFFCYNQSILRIIDPRDDFQKIYDHWVVK